MHGYELLDAGGGARLERFGARVVDRPFVAAAEPRRDRDAWHAADLVFDDGHGWHGDAGLEPWTAAIDGLTLELRPTETGQVGFFPEHATTWPWLSAQLADRPDPSVLALFAYTGAGTLALARAGAHIAHVDASRPAVAWARRNAELSGLADRPIRWLVDDARGFAEREARRGRRYDGIVLDPPSYGHGARGRTFRLPGDLPGLLDACAAVLDPEGFVLLTAHTPALEPDRLGGHLAHALGVAAGEVEHGPLVLTARSGARLELGGFARWSGR